MTQHTPGPWTATGSSVFAGSLPIAHTFLNPGIDVDHANARLIAAAPELLKACRLLLDAVNEHHKDGSILWVSPGTTAWELLTDVIEKATSKQS